MENLKREHYLAKTFAGLEEVLKHELENIGALECEVVNRGVKFEGNQYILYKANYFCRTAIRILWQVYKFKFNNNNNFYDAIFNFPAEEYLRKDGTLAISTTLSETIFSTPLFASVLAKDAICDRFRSLYDERPSVDKERPDVQFHLHLYKESGFIYLDSSGESLHKRGYKVSQHPAAISEIVAAGMIYLSNWDGKCDFIDPMCGGGTLLIEAAMMALNIPAGYYRSRFGFYTWKNFDRSLWKSVTQSANILENINIDLYGSDISPRYLGMAKANIEEANLQDFIFLRKGDMRFSTPKHTPALVMINPPYGERLEVEDIDLLYKEIGDSLKHNYPNCEAWIISSDKEALKKIGLRTSHKFTLYNGALECKFHSFPLYQIKN